ncbi:MAG: Fe-S cluster assembly protein SufD [Myxococcota bacterium]
MTSNEEQLRGLPQRIATGGPDWLVGLRRSAAQHLEERGFPTRKTEAWRFTPVEPLARASFAPAPSAAADRARAVAARRVGDDGTWRLIVANGRPVLDAAGAPPDGVSVRSLAEVLEREPGLLEGQLGAHAPKEDFAALNAALFTDGVVLRVDDGAVVERPLHLVHVGLAGDATAAAYPRVLVLVGRSAQARLVETFVVDGGAEHLTNVVAEVALAEDAQLDHVRVNEGAPNGLHAGALAVHQARSSVYRSRVVTLGGALSRLDLRATLAGEGAECHLEGVYYAAGTDHVDHHTRVDHATPRCASTEVYRGILDDKGHGVFDGTVIVRPHAQHSDAHQENRNLLLSDEAGVHTKPHLEIEADDVKCSHGATIGSLDEAQAFYLRTRGIGAEQARALLTFAFVRELLDRIPHEPLRHRLGAALLDRLPHGDAIRELA